MARTYRHLILVNLAVALAIGSAAAVAESNSTSIELFATPPAVQEVTLSPSGNHFAALAQLQGQTVLLVADLAKQEKPYIAASKEWRIKGYQWINDSDILLEISLPEKIFRTPITVTRLVHVDIQKRAMQMMFAREESNSFFQIQSSVVGKLPDQSREFLIAGSKDDPAKPRVFQVKAGAQRLPRRAAQGWLRGIRQWYADARGNVRAAIGVMQDQRTPIGLLKDANGVWQDFSHLLKRNAVFHGALTDNGNHYLIQMFPKPSDSEDTPPSRYRSLFKINAHNGVETLISTQPDSDIAGVRLSHDGSEIVAVFYENENLAPDYLRESTRGLINAIDAALPNTTNRVVSANDTESRAIILARHASKPAQYYFYDATKRSLRPLQNTYPKLRSAPLAEVQSITYSARDELTIPGYLTLPVGTRSDTRPRLPFVVLPHGGPHARDFARFDWLTQMLASQGYGVLQMNFRGSTGYGVEFQELGANQWGQLMQDDITDGTRWLIEQGLADANRICIAGGSYGGYAALMGAAKESKLYRCAASFNGVSDLRQLVKDQLKYVDGRYASRFIGNLWRDKDMLIQNSPVNLAEQIDIPILLVHGKDDRVVPVAHSQRMADALVSKPVTYVELPKGDHNFSSATTRIAFARQLVAFLNENLGEP
tara:strand:+ start:5763 stop:7724 length:1962 start_codon:yes stop_codon:yes gene_type:complete